MFTHTEEQRFIIDKAKKFYYNDYKQVFQYSGGPGRGKTVVLNSIIDELGINRNRVAPMAYIGAAAINLRTKRLINARTIHSWLFHPVEDIKIDNTGKIQIDSYLNKVKYDLYFEPKPLDNIDLILIDEGYTVPRSLKYEIESRGIKIIVCGDKDQLPPVGDEPAYLYDGEIYYLTEPIRQKKDSGILYLAERAKLGLPIHQGFYGDALVINEDELTNEMILQSEIIICSRNTTRDYLNKRVRQDILHIGTDLPMQNEKVVCRKNNWNIEVDGINLANGLIGTVVNSPDAHGFDGKIFKMDFKPNMMNIPFLNLSCDYNYLIAPYTQKQMIKNNKYSVGEKMEFANSITTHMSQGSEFHSGIYIEEFLNRDIQKNLNYTGITRFKNFLIYVKRKKKYY